MLTSSLPSSHLPACHVKSVHLHDPLAQPDDRLLPHPHTRAAAVEGPHADEQEARPDSTLLGRALCHGRRRHAVHPDAQGGQGASPPPCWRTERTTDPVPKNPITGPAVGAAWAARECFVAIVTSNLPMIWMWARQEFGPRLRSRRRSSAAPGRSNTNIIMLGVRGRTSWWHRLWHRAREDRLVEKTSSSGQAVLHSFNYRDTNGANSRAADEEESPVAVVIPGRPMEHQASPRDSAISGIPTS